MLLCVTVIASAQLCKIAIVLLKEKRMGFKYRESVINQLINHGIKPDETTPPELVREFINDLYRYEIRLLKKRLLDGLIPQSQYAKTVLELRNRYPVLGLPVQFWTESE
jgi:hypothetical protein